MIDWLLLWFVAWIVYWSESLWWVGRDTWILVGDRTGALRLQQGPHASPRGGAGLYVAGMTLRPRWRVQLPDSRDGLPSSGAPKATKARLSEVINATGNLRRWSLGLALWIFAGAPLAIFSFGLARTWLGLVISILAWTTAIVIQFASEWRRMYPDAPRAWHGPAATMLLSPFGAINASDRLVRHAFRSFGLVDIIESVAPDAEVIRTSRMLYFSPEASEHTRSAITDMLARRTLGRVLFTPPPRLSPDALSYCPRCQEQLFRVAGECPDCDWVTLVPFDPVQSR